MLQESFIRVFSYFGQYRSEGSLEGWIRRIVVHTCLKLIQKRKIQFLDLDENQETAPFIAADVLSNLDAEDLLKLISSLPGGYRMIFNLYVVEGYDHNEIAALLNISPGTSRSQLSKARNLLKTQIENLQKFPNKYA